MMHRIPDRFPDHIPHHTHLLGGFWPGIFTLVLLGLLTALAVWAIVGVRRRPPWAAPPPVPPPASPPEDAAVREARMRYARGEINREQFLEISSDLQGTPPASS